MQCPRIRHFARLNHNGTIGKCGHMTGAPEFALLKTCNNPIGYPVLRALCPVVVGRKNVCVVN